MFFLERLEQAVRPNILGNKSFPVYTHQWKAICACAERQPLDEMLERLDKKTHRITSNNGGGEE